MLAVIAKTLPDDNEIREALQTTFCVPRGIDTGVLDNLKNGSLLAWTARSADEYLAALLSTHLFDVDSYLSTDLTLLSGMS